MVADSPPTPAEGGAVRSGRVGALAVTTAPRIGPDGWDVADAVVEEGRLTTLEALRPGPVVAGCEPGLQLLEGVLRSRGMAAVAA